jgi:hypothetical protein
MTAVPDPVAAGLDQALVEELARQALQRAAPEELALFPETAAEYFADPAAVLSPRRRDEPVGFGLDLAMLTPYALAVAGSVLSFLASTVADAVRAEGTPVVGEWIRRLLRRDDADTAPARAQPEPRLTAQQADQVRGVALARARDLGLAEAQARLLADSVVGGLRVAT